MQKSERIVRYTADAVEAMRMHGEGRTDFDHLDALTEEEIGASIDHAEEGEIDWSTIQVGIPGPKQQLTVRFDLDVIDWFKSQGSGYQTRMNAVLKSYVDAQKKRQSSTAP